MNITLPEFFTHLIQKKNFYARLASSLQRVSQPGIKTMAVGVSHSRATLYYDPEFISGISMSLGLFALEHEMIHLVMDHLPRYFELLSRITDRDERIKARHIYNIAMDCAVNTLLAKHPQRVKAEAEFRAYLQAKRPDQPLDEKDGMVFPEKFDLPPDQSFDFYLHELMKRTTVIHVPFGLGDSHGFWVDEDVVQDPDMATPDELLTVAHRLRDHLKEAIKSTLRSQGKGRGLLPGYLEAWLEQYLADPIIPWWDVLKTRVRASRQAKFDRSMAVPNRRLIMLAEEDPLVIPALGRVRDSSYRLHYFVDTSGSQSDEDLKIAASELTHLLAVDEGIEIRHMQGDAAVHFDVVLHHGDVVSNKAIGRGGTDFNEYFKYIQQYVADPDTRPDLVIVHTDGYAPSVTPENRLPADIPVIWLVTPFHSISSLEGYGEVIVCDPEHRALRKDDK